MSALPPKADMICVATRAGWMWIKNRHAFTGQAAPVPHRGRRH